MTFIPNNPTVDDESVFRPAVTEDIYHFKIHEGLGYSASIASAGLTPTDFASGMFTTPHDPTGNLKMHALVTFAGEKGIDFEVYEDVIPTAKISVLATAMIIGQTYAISTKGTTDFRLSGARSNAVGVVFTATAAGIGTGTATPDIRKVRLLNRASFGPHLAQVILCANQGKKVMNAHAIDITQHLLADSVNFPIVAPDATDLPSLIVLVAELQAAYTAHHADAKLVVPIAHIGQFIGTTGDLASIIPPTDLASARTVLLDLQLKYNIHDNDILPHTLGGLHDFGLVLGGSAVTTEDSTTTLATGLTAATSGDRFCIVLAGTTDFTLLGAADSNIGTVFTHNGVIGLGTGTVFGHIRGVISASTVAPIAPAVSTLFSGGELIEDGVASKGSVGGSTEFEFVLKEDTTYGIRAFDSQLNGAPLGFNMVWFEVPLS